MPPLRVEIWRGRYLWEALLNLRPMGAGSREKFDQSDAPEVNPDCAGAMTDQIRVRGF